jgi:serine/threonine protein kinase
MTANTTHAFEPPNAESLIPVTEKATVPEATLAWISRLRNAQTSLDPKATLSYIVARDDQTAPCPWTAPEFLRKVHDDFAAGTVLQDRYRLIRELGRGGMGIVYLGRDQRLDRSVAVKFILSRDGSASGSATVQSQAQASFAEEARLGASLTHPAIATVFDFGYHNENPFTIFEYIEGETLRELMDRRRRLPLDEVRLIIGGLAQALDFAHARGIIHRDLKPENVRATEQRQFKVLDLGLAREFSRQADWRFAGTPAYAAPEQAAERPSDGRTDQYALAVIVFELVTGRRPFEHDSWLDVLEDHLSTPPPRPRSIAADLPETVEDAILKSLEKDPNRRFSSCTELAVALGCQFLTGPAPLPQILLESNIKKMGGRWKTVLFPFSFGRPRTHLSLAPDALWAIHRTELMRWPLAAIHDLRRRGFRGLSFRIRNVAGKDQQWFRFNNRAERRRWYASLESLIPPEQPAGSPGNGRESFSAAAKTDRIAASAADAPSDPRVEPVVLLAGRPGTRFQLLGRVESTGTKLRTAQNSLAIRGAMMGADAVVDLNAERLPSFAKTDHRASGIAVRAVDDEGRRELRSRWFAGQIDQLKAPMLALALLELLFAIVGCIKVGYFSEVPEFEKSSLLRAQVGEGVNLAFASVMTALTVGMIFSRWPQLVRPTAVCLFAKAAQLGLMLIAALATIGAIGLSILGLVPGFADVGISDKVVPAVTAIAVFATVVYGFWLSSFIFFDLYLGRRAWRIGQEMLSLAANSPGSRSIPVRRRAIGTLARCAAIAIAAATIGWQAWAFYQRVAESSLVARSEDIDSMQAITDVFLTSTRFATSSRKRSTRTNTEIADKFNEIAWRQATDPEPAARLPTQALANAEKAVAARPDDPLILNTRGVARYRTGSFTAAVVDLERSIMLRKFNAHDGFFLAMTYAQMGHLEQAQKLYAESDEWMRANAPADTELMRFREEAGAVLYVTTRAASKTATKAVDPPKHKHGQAPR